MSVTDPPGALARNLRWKWFVLAGFGVLLIAGGAVVVSDLWRRPRAVGGSDVLRSGQLEPNELKKTIARNGVRTVVNLRGHGGGREWFPEEVRVCREMGVALFTVPFIVDDWAPRFRVVQFVELLGRAQRPMLMHCRRGADRTGLGAAVVVLFEGGTMAEAAAQLTLTGGHYCRGEFCPQHRFLEAYRRHLEDTNQSTSHGVFTRWVNEQYCPAPYDAALSMTPPVPEELAAGAVVKRAVRVENRGSEPWVMTSGPAGVRLGVRAFGPYAAFPDDPAQVCHTARDQGRDLGRSGVEDGVIEPGDGRVLPVDIRVPETPGLYLLQIDMVQEHVHWFSDLGWPGIIVKIRVAGERDESQNG